MLPLNNSRTITQDRQTGEQTIEASIVDTYASRAGIQDVNLVSFVSKYTTIKGHLARRSSEVIVRTFPQFSSNSHSKTYGQYCKYQLLEYKPWSHSMSNARNNCPDTDEDYIMAYKQFLAIPHIDRYITNFASELNNASHAQAEDIEDSPDPSTEDQTEEWMTLCHLNQQFSQSVDEEDSFDWYQAAQALPPEILRTCPSWVHDQQ